MLCAIWYHLYNLKNIKNTDGGVLLLEPATLLKVTLFHWWFWRFLNCTNDTKSSNALHISFFIEIAFSELISYESWFNYYKSIVKKSLTYISNLTPFQVFHQPFFLFFSLLTWRDYSLEVLRSASTKLTTAFSIVLAFLKGGSNIGEVF